MTEIINQNKTSLASEQEEQKKRIVKIILERIQMYNKELTSYIGQEAFNFLDNGMRMLLLTSILLQKIFRTLSTDVKQEDLKPIDLDVIADDYSFIAFPAAKAFEGYLKKLLIKLRLIKKSELKKDPFKTIGYLLNSEKFEKKVRDKRFRHIPKEVQVEWDKSRNYILHYDIDKIPKISKEDTDVRISAILKIIKESYNAFCGKQ